MLDECTAAAQTSNPGKSGSSRSCFERPRGWGSQPSRRTLQPEACQDQPTPRIASMTFGLKLATGTLQMTTVWQIPRNLPFGHQNASKYSS